MVTDLTCDKNHRYIGSFDTECLECKQMSKVEQLIKEVLELDRNATKGPWEVEGKFDKMVRTDILKYHKGYGIRASNPDCEMIAHYRSSAPRLARALDIAMEFINYSTNGLDEWTAKGVVEKIEKIVEGREMTQKTPVGVSAENAIKRVLDLDAGCAYEKTATYFYMAPKMALSLDIAIKHIQTYFVGDEACDSENRAILNRIDAVFAEKTEDDECKSEKL